MEFCCRLGDWVGQREWARGGWRPDWQLMQVIGANFSRLEPQMQCLFPSLSQLEACRTIPGGPLFGFAAPAQGSGAPKPHKDGQKHCSRVPYSPLTVRDIVFGTPSRIGELATMFWPPLFEL